MDEKGKREELMEQLLRLLALATEEQLRVLYTAALYKKRRPSGLLFFACVIRGGVGCAGHPEAPEKSLHSAPARRH